MTPAHMFRASSVRNCLLMCVLKQHYVTFGALAVNKQNCTHPHYLCHAGECTSPCLNGGWCVHPDSCNCTLYQATGTHCQTVPNLGFEREMTCRSWGQYNYETFDGLYYYFPGKCSYTLLRDCEDSTRSSVHIQVHNDPECSSFPYSCTRSISLFLPWEGEIRLQNFSVTFKGQSVQLPHHIHDVELERISDYIVVSQPQGFTLAWQGLTGSVYIKMSPEFVGHTCGLCGNFNADTQDDLKTSYGVFTQDLAMFGNSWAEEEPQLGRCPVVPSLYPSPCDSGSSLSGPNGDVVCQVFIEYARACAHAGHPLHNWRSHFPVCVDCPAELLFRECITCCPMHCKIEHMCIDSKLQCLDGCYCPDGRNITLNELIINCPCEHHGMLSIDACVCINVCIDFCSWECSVTGDMFFQSFDGRIYTFPATCQYVLAKSRNSGKFTVTIQNAPCGAVSPCALSCSPHQHKLQVLVFLASHGFFSDVFQIQELSSMFVQVKSSQGLQLQYNWREFRLYLQLEEQWRDDTVGLCGTFNGNIQDDFLAPSGMIESTPYLFGNAWRVSSACVARPSLPQLDPCDTHQQAAAYAVEKCDVLTQEVFSACHEYVSPVGFQLQCRADVCKCGAPCLCSILAHYARTCRRHGVIIEFRSHLPECAITCPSSMEYGVCVSSCQRRCLFLSLHQPCGEECEEGCVCPEGTYFNMHTHTCVPRVCSLFEFSYLQCWSSVCVLSSLSDTLCPPGQFYEDCGNRVDGHSANKGLACEQTCESYLLNLTCSTREPCVPGCVCPAGVCQHGTFQCEFRPCPSMCTAYGDRHYRTFDGFLFDYIGACKVYLVKVIFYVIDRQKVYIWQAGYYTIVHLLGEDLTVLWDRKSTVHIQAGPRWQGKLTGLCGNFDQKTANEMRTPENIDLSTPQEFGNNKHTYTTNVTWFYMNCLVDTCGCNRGGDCECFCTSVAAYAHRCCQKGVTIDWRSPSVCPYDCEYYNKARPHDTSLVSFEAAERPNYFLKAEHSGQLRLQKWEEAEAFWDAATFVLHRDTWISGFDSLESLAKPGFFLHFMLSRLQLMKYSHSDRYRRATLFKLTGGIPHYPMGPRCQWRYESCVSPCFRACSDPSGLSCASILKVEGCLPQCPSHMVLDEVTHRCVFMEDCKLLIVLLLILLSPYSEVVDECTKLICVSGQLLLFNKSQSCPYDPTPPNCGLLGFAVLVNGDKCCPRWDCPCRCSVFPDLNLITFDGKSVAIYKAALYVVAQLPNETVSILVQECSGPDDTRFKIYNGLFFFQLYVNSGYAKPRFKKFGFEILDTGNMYLIRSPAGLKIQWFHTTGMMVIEMDSYNNRLPTMGLCGSCDGNPLNDLTLSNGTVVPEQEDPAVFIDSWQIPNTTSYVSHSRRREVNCTTGDCSQCMSMLSNRTFTICHPYVPPAMFCEMWVRDVEYVNNPCVALAAYAASCHKFNICMEWRSSDFCPFMCPENLRYQACLPACTAPSCPNQDFEFVPEQCTGLSEGCVCPEGTLLHRPYSALCIPPSKCACTDSFGTPRALGEVWKASLDGCCMYKCENDSIVPVEYNCSNIPQPVCTRTGEITVNLADDSSCCPQKACGFLFFFYCVFIIVLVCDKCSEAAPVCQDGELLIVDTNSTERCCPVYHCCEYKHMNKQTDILISTRIQDQCCPSQTCGKPTNLMIMYCLCSLREAVCVDGERGVMRPGQTLVEHRDQGVCYTTQCTHTLDSATGFYLLRATGTNCTARCQPVNPSSCCGMCKNVSCLIRSENGSVTIWVSDCMRYDCMDTLSGPVRVSHPYSCPPFNETECMKNEKDNPLTFHAVGKEDGKSCQKVTVRMTIRKNDCRSNRPVNIVSCDGKCPSASIYNYNINTYARFCKCCREMGLQRRSVQLYCSGNSTWVSYTIQEPTDCSCQWS
uniref:Otogelin-like n=1 Tax=Sinocyclocheilus rhinocerous TaxID=307959 RepID=A0A673LA48_9TELE